LTNPRTLDLSGVQLTFTTASILSDVLAIEWGLRKLVFRECNLDELVGSFYSTTAIRPSNLFQILKPMLHALLIPNSLTFLSVALNRRLKAPAYRLLGAYSTKAKTLQFLDLSQNPLDKKSVEYIIAALTVAPIPGLASLRMDDCALKPGALEALSRVVRTSSLRNISLRLNRINSTGAVALALMIRDYPDTMQSPSLPSSTSSSPASSAISLPPTPSTPQPKPGPLLPPPRHPPPGNGVQTTYTPYVPRAKRTTVAKPAPALNNVPIIASSSQGGVTARHPANGNSAPSHTQGPSAALLDKVRALDNLPRVGALRTLDLKGNDLKVVRASPTHLV
jgi:protein phosphatase 1 regulatory subunit 37